MSHSDPHHDPENVRSEDSKFAPRAKTRALKRFHYKGTKYLKVHPIHKGERKEE